MSGGTLSRYIAGRTLRGICIALLIVTAIIALVDYVEASRTIGTEANLSPLDLLILTSLKIPKLIEQTIPFVVLFGVMGALAGMNRRSELTVMRAAGLSAWRFLRPSLIVTAIIGLLWATIVNPLSSQMMGQYDARTEQLTSGKSNKEIWLREGSNSAQRVIHAESLDLKTKQLDNPVFFEIAIAADGRTVFERRYDAKKAKLLTPGFWTLEDVIENAPGEAMQRAKIITLPTNIGLDDLREQSGQRVDPPFWTIRKEIAANEAAGFSARELRLQFHKLIALPFMLVAMTFIAAGVSMYLVRGGGTLRLLITGAVLGFGVFFADSVLTAFGEAAILPVILAAWAVPALVLLVGIAHLARIEDG